MANQLASENTEQSSERKITRADNNPPSLIALLIEQLTDTYKLEFAKVQPLRDRANALMKRSTTIDSDELLGEWTAVYNDARELFTGLDAARKNEKRPFEQAVNDTFKTHVDPLDNILTWVRKNADDYNREKQRKQRAEEAAERERLAAIERKAREDAAIAAEFGDTDAAIEHVGKVHEASAQRAEQETVKTTDATRVRSAGGTASAGSVWKFRVADYAEVDLNAIRMLIPQAAIDKAIAAVVKQQKGQTKIKGVEVYEDVATRMRK